MRRIDGLLDSFGLRGQKDTLIGTPIRSGISGGQKRRVSVASQLITAPKLLFLDEPTSGLDSVASLEVISYIKDVAKRNNVCTSSSASGDFYPNEFLLAPGHCQYPSAFNNNFRALRQTAAPLRWKDPLLRFGLWRWTIFQFFGISDAASNEPSRIRA